IFPLIFFFLFILFSVQFSAAQDSSNYIPPVPKRTAKHRHLVKDSTASTIGDSGLNKELNSQDTSTNTTTVAKKTSVLKDTLTIKSPRLKKSNKQLVILNDSTDYEAKYFYNNVVRIIRIPRKKVKLSFLPVDSVINNDLIVDSAAAAISDSIKIAVRDSLFIVDSLKSIATAFTDSVNKDSIRRHWIGWKKYQINPDQSFAMYSKRVLKGKSKSQLQYNIADFYLYLNGQLVMPPIKGFSFFAAGCLCFKYDDTLLLNSGLGFKVGVGVGIKIIQGRFTSSLHANKHNLELYKLSEEDSVYLRSIMAVPITQTLKLQSEPAYTDNEIIIGEYRATYKKFYQKNKDDEDEGRQYMVRIIFRCRVSGGIDSMKSLNSPGSK
ncbi:MAG TPA: hypothetical protein VNW49_01910, partial [Puia sp.]|nr:hypothetical protein [Puia sp.]